MIEENEIVRVILATGVLIFSYLNRSYIKRINNWILLSISFILLFCGWIFTVAEGFFLFNLFNTAEHLLYALSNILLLVWCWKTAHSKEPERRDT
ncbi:MAG: hypothetical protein ACOCSE_04480 [Chitinivibrionales bacterium]